MIVASNFIYEMRGIYHKSMYNPDKTITIQIYLSICHTKFLIGNKLMLVINIRKQMSVNDLILYYIIYTNLFIGALKIIIYTITYIKNIQSRY